MTTESGDIVTDLIDDTDVQTEEENETSLAEQTVELVIDGETVTQTVGDLMMSAQKTGAADNRLREAAQLLKAHKSDIEMAKALRAGASGDTDALVKGMAALGIDEEAARAHIAAQSSYGQTEDSTQRTVMDDPMAAFQPEEVAQLKQFLGAAASRGMSIGDLGNALAAGTAEQGRQNVRTQVTGMIHNHEGLKKLVAGNSKRETAITELAMAKLSERLSDPHVRCTTETIRNVVKDTANAVSNLEMAPHKDPDASSIGGVQLLTEDGVGADKLPAKSTGPVSIHDGDEFTNHITRLLNEGAAGSASS